MGSVANSYHVRVTTGKRRQGEGNREVAAQAAEKVGVDWEDFTRNSRFVTISILFNLLILVLPFLDPSNNPYGYGHGSCPHQ